MMVPILNRADTGPRSDVEQISCYCMRQRRKIRKSKVLSSEQHNDVFQFFQEHEFHYDIADLKTDV